MKRFKTYKRIKKQKLVLYLLLILSLTISFIVISLQKLKEEYNSLINYVLSDTVFNLNYDNHLFRTNLNKLIPTLSFNNVKQMNNNTDVFLYYDNDNLCLMLKDYLEKLGIRVFLISDSLERLDDLFFIKLQYSEEKDSLIINNRFYAKIKFMTNNSDILKQFNHYLNENYLGLLEEIIASEKRINNCFIIQINKTDNIKEVNNTLEVLALMIYSTILST